MNYIMRENKGLQYIVNQKIDGGEVVESVVAYKLSKAEDFVCGKNLQVFAIYLDPKVLRKYRRINKHLTSDEIELMLLINRL